MRLTIGRFQIIWYTLFWILSGLVGLAFYWCQVNFIVALLVAGTIFVFWFNGMLEIGARIHAKREKNHCTKD